MVESSGLLNRRTGLNLYRGFESPSLRQIPIILVDGLYANNGGEPESRKNGAMLTKPVQSSRRDRRL